MKAILLLLICLTPVFSIHAQTLDELKSKQAVKKRFGCGHSGKSKCTAKTN